AALRAELDELFGERIEARRQQALDTARRQVRHRVLQEVMLRGDGREVWSAVENALDFELKFSASPNDDARRLTRIARDARNHAAARHTTELILNTVSVILAARNQS